MLLVVGTFGGVTAAGAAEPDPNPCALASALVEARQLEAALTTYLGSAAECPGAAADLRELNDARLERDTLLAQAAQALEASGEKDLPAETKAAELSTARLSYVGALEIDAASAEAADGLAALDAAPGEETDFAGAKALLDAGLREEAKTELAKVLATGKTIPTDDEYDGLRALAAGNPDGSLDGLREFVTGVIEFSAWFVGVVLSLVLVVLVAVGLVNHVVLERVRRKRTRRAATTSGFRRWWRRLTQPRLNVVAGDGDNTKMFVLRVRETLRRLDKGLDGAQIRFASMPEQDLDLAELGDIDARLKPVLAALTFAKRRDTVTVTLSTGSDDDTHPRVGAEAVARKAEGYTATFSRPAAAAGTDVPALVGIAAAWTLFSAEAMRPRLRDGADRAVTYGTDDQRSYSAYLGGDAARRAGDLATARSMLAVAVAHDGDFERAKLDLGAVELMSPDPVVRDAGLERLLLLHRMTTGASAQ